MKAKEIVLLIFIIVAGIIFYQVKTGNIIEDWNLDFAFDLEEFTYEESEVIEPPLPASLRVINAHGNVIVQGADTDRITLTLEKRIWRRTEEEAGKIAERLHPIVSKDESRVTISTNRDELRSRRMHIGFYRGFETDLSLTVPQNMTVDIENRYGLAKAVQVGSTSINNPHGQVAVSQVEGKLRVTNSYEDVDVEGVHSACDLESRHSNLRARDIEGEMTIDQSHGLVRLWRIGQKITLSGPHTEVIGEDLPGLLDIRNSYEKISLRRVGPTKIEGHHSPVEVDDVNGDLDITDNYDSADLRNIRGNIKVSGNNLSVSGKNLTGENISVSSSYEKIELVNFAGRTTVRNSHGDVVLTPLALTGPLDVACNNSAITLYWPEGGPYPFAAQTKNGDVLWRVPGEISVEEKNHLTTARAFLDLSGKPSIKLDTTYNDIRIEPGFPAK
jgi:hypothetical protein